MSYIKIDYTLGFSTHCESKDDVIESCGFEVGEDTFEDVLVKTKGEFEIIKFVLFLYFGLSCFGIITKSKLSIFISGRIIWIIFVDILNFLNKYFFKNNPIDADLLPADMMYFIELFCCNISSLDFLFILIKDFENKKFGINFKKL